MEVQNGIEGVYRIRDLKGIELEAKFKNDLLLKI